MNPSGRLALILLLFFTPVCLAADGLSIGQEHGALGDTVTFAVSIKKAPVRVNAFILDIRYDPSVLNFTSHARGALAQGYSMFMVNEYSPGTIRVGGVDPVNMGIGAGDSGVFFTLTFEVTGEGDSDLSFTVLKDDLKGWPTRSGRFKFQGKETKKEDQEKDEQEAGTDDPADEVTEEPAAEDDSSGAKKKSSAGGFQSASTLSEASDNQAGSSSLLAGSQPGGATPSEGSGKKGEAKTRPRGFLPNLAGKSPQGNLSPTAASQGGDPSPTVSGGGSVPAEKLKALRQFSAGLQERRTPADARPDAADVVGEPPEGRRRGSPGAPAAVFLERMSNTDDGRILTWALLALLLAIVALILVIMAVILVLLALIHRRLKLLEKPGPDNGSGWVLSFSRSGVKQAGEPE